MIQQTLGDLERPSAGGTIEYVSMISQPPTSRDRYTLTPLHAKGGIGQVWLARDTAMDREVALKELRPDRSDNDRDAAAVPRGGADHRASSSTRGSCRSTSWPAVETERRRGAPYYTMRFVRGRTLSEAVARLSPRTRRRQGQSLELLALLQAFVGVCNAVAYAHSRA